PNSATRTTAVRVCRSLATSIAQAAAAMAPPTFKGRFRWWEPTSTDSTASVTVSPASKAEPVRPGMHTKAPSMSLLLTTRTYASRGCSRALLARSKLVLPLCSLGAAGGHCWLLTAVRGHFGGAERTGDP